MKISINRLQPTGNLYISELRTELSGDSIYQVLPALSLRERSEVQTYLGGGRLPSRTTLLLLRQALTDQAGSR